MIEDPNVDLRDIRFNNGSGLVTTESLDHALAMRWAEYRETMRRAYPDEARAHEMLDELREEIKELKRDSKVDEQAEMKLVQAREEHQAAIRARTEARVLLNTNIDKHPLLAWMRLALTTVSADPFKQTMTHDELVQLLETAGKLYADFTRLTGYVEGDKIPLWVRVLVRSLHPPPRPRKRSSS